MKSTRHQQKQRLFSIVGRNRQIALPPEMVEFRLGQRVYFFADGNRVQLLSKPKGLINGRLMSARIRRAIRSLDKYGPHARR